MAPAGALGSCGHSEEVRAQGGACHSPGCPRKPGRRRLGRVRVVVPNTGKPGHCTRRLGTAQREEAAPPSKMGRVASGVHSLLAVILQVPAKASGKWQHR